MLAMSDGPTHPYIGASPACWAVYCEILDREYGEFAYPPVHRLTVDAYAAQHPGVPSRRSIQSVATHLIGLFLIFERRLGDGATTRAMRHALSNADRFEWLEPPSFERSLRITDVCGAATLAEHTARVEVWARSVWDAWEAHHGVVRCWAE